MIQLIGGIEIAIAITVVKTLVLVLGGVITYFAFKAYRRTRQAALGYLAAGFGIVTLGLVLAGTMHQLLGISLEGGVLIESLLVLVGFGIIAYSLYVQ